MSLKKGIFKRSLFYGSLSLWDVSLVPYYSNSSLYIYIVERKTSNYWFEIFLWLQCCCCCCCCCCHAATTPISVVSRGGIGSEDSWWTHSRTRSTGWPYLHPQTVRSLVQIARDPVIFKRQRHCDETEIEDEHGHSQDLAHLPAGHQDREENKKKHWKQKNNGAAHPFAGHLDRVTKCKSI